MSAIYWQVTGPAVRRALSLQDANSASATYGCCDRSFWQYRTITSFPAATMQQLALPFAVLFETAFPGNEWHQNGGMFDRARSAMLFWARSQHASGTVDEWYLNEHSYCATAFTTFGVAEACLRLHPHLAPSDRDEIQRAVSRSARWLGERFNDEVMNQNLAASAALWNVHQLTGEARFKEAFERTWQRTLANQDREGWFVEYGGADLGYSLLALDLLAALDRRGCAEAAPAAERLSRFVASFAVGGGDLAGRIGSRGTEHSFPYGAEAFAPSLPDAGAIAQHLRGALERGTISDPRTVDDRYLAYFYLPSFVMASSLGDRAVPAATLAIEEVVVSQPVRGAHSSATWDTSGFTVRSGRGGTVVCSTNRRAAFNIYAPSLPVHRNLGYWIETADRRRFASCPWTSQESAGIATAERVTAQGAFVEVDDALPLVAHEVSFRAATQWVFRWPMLAEPFHRFIKKRKISRKIAGPIAFKREVTWRGDGLVVRDEIRTDESKPQLRTVTPTADIEVHSPSARLSGGSRNGGITVTMGTAEAWAAEINRTGRLTLVTHYEIDAGGRLQFVGIEQESDASRASDPIEAL
jgi:hypothetical protein